MDPLILGEMYEHPERFGHLDKAEYFRILIEDIRHWRRSAERLQAMQTLLLHAPEGSSDTEILLALRALARLPLHT